MPTNRDIEAVVGSMYPASMRHLQQLIMDAEGCAKSYGKRTLLGKDKFEPAFDKFMDTLGACVHALAQDGYLDDPKDVEVAMAALNEAFSRCVGVQQLAFSVPVLEGLVSPVPAQA